MSNVEYQAIIELLQAEYKRSLFKCAKFLCGYKDITHYTHDNIIAALESSSKRKLIVAPRGSFKSSLGVTAYCIWLLLNNPNLRIFISSETYVNSKNFLREIKAIMQSKHFVDVFGDLKGSIWGESEISISTRTKAFKEASITIGSVGTIKVGQHYDVMLLDDLNSNQNSNTPENCHKIIDYYRYLISILEPNGTISITATRYSVLDIPGVILKNEINI
jgi:hypothetical protein